MNVSPTFGEVLQTVSVCIAFGSLIYTSNRFKADKSRVDAGMVAERTEQKVRQEAMSKQLTEILESVRAINAKLDDHSLLLARHSEQLTSVFRRLEWLENVLGKHVHTNDIGGTDG